MKTNSHTFTHTQMQNLSYTHNLNTNTQLYLPKFVIKDLKEAQDLEGGGHQEDGNE